jgi:hypothetical protein
MHEAGRVEQDIDRAHPLGHRGDSSGIAHVKPRHLRHALPGERSQALLVDIGRKHRGAFARKRDGRGASDARGARGHECAFALEAV